MSYSRLPEKKVFNESHLKVTKNAFYFILKTYLVLKIFIYFFLDFLVL